MNFAQELILGAIQGITEWLPISSEGVSTLIMMNFFHVNFAEAVYRSIWLHAGTLAAAVVYYRAEIRSILKQLPIYFNNIRQSFAFKPGDTVNYLVIATVVSVAVGGPLLLLGIDKIQLPAAVITAFIGIFLIITGIVQRLSQRGDEPKLERMVNWKESILTGVAQGFSVLPGISRSGMTISMLLFFRYSPGQALKLSFLLSILGVFIAELAILITGKINLGPGDVASLLSSFLVGFLAIYGLVKLAIKVPFWGFCIFFGLLSFIPWIISL